MRKQQKERLKGVLGMLLIVLAIAGIFLWESYGREALTYAQVLVCKEDVQAGAVITSKDLGLMNVDKATLIKNRVKDPDQIVGKKARNYIPKGMQLSNHFFAEPGMVTGDGHYVFSIPDDWIYTYPQTIRRGDTVYFYAVPKLDTGNPPWEGKALLSAKVAYVKDSANREVVDITPDRIDASADASTIEIIVDDDMYKTVKDASESGYRFILMYE